MAPANTSHVSVLKGRFWPGILRVLFAWLSLAGLAALSHAAQPPDIESVPADLAPPALSEGAPAPGKRVLQWLPEYAGTAVCHALYLPLDWEKGKRYPVIIEYNGNSRRVRDGSSVMGYGISGGKGFIWAVLPYVGPDHRTEMDWWWGDVETTVAYAKKAVPEICRQWGGDPGAVLLVGCSRGAIACNYIGLHDDGIARLWRGMVAHSHYDTGLVPWGMSETERALSVKRLRRLGKTPQFISGEYHLPTGHQDQKLLAMVKERKFESFEQARRELDLIPMLIGEKIKSFVTTNYPQGNFTFVDLPFVNHTAAWVLRDIPERQRLRDWVRSTLQGSMDRRTAELKNLKWGMFICWSFSTFSGKEWTPGIKDAAFFKPTGCDTDQWARTAKEAGMGYILFLTKHHDGFCLWDTQTTERKVTRSPLGLDVLAALRKSCDKYGIKLALYFSEGDWTWPGAVDGKGGKGGSNPEMKKAQLKELLTRYGPVEYIWFDHAVGDGGLSHAETVKWVKQFQPGCFVGFNHGDQEGADIRLGEMGRPGPLTDATAAGPYRNAAGATTYRLAEFTYPILPPHQGGAMWFYSLPRHDGLCKPAAALYRDYLGAVKYGNVFALDVGPDYAGRLREIDVKTLREVGKMIRAKAPSPK